MTKIDFSHILNIPGVSTSLFSYDKTKKVFEINRTDLPDDPSPSEAQQTFLFPGAISQTFAGVLNYNIALTPHVKWSDQSIKTDSYFADTFGKTIIVLTSEKTNIKAYFNLLKSKDDSFYKYAFAGIYPFDPTTFKRMRGHTVVVHNI